MGNWLDDLKSDKKQPTKRTEQSWLDRFKESEDKSKTSIEQTSTIDRWSRTPEEQVEPTVTQKHSWDISDKDKKKTEKRRNVNALKFKGIDMLKEEWAQKKSSELIRLARDIGSVLNEQRDNEEDIDTTLLSYLDELRKILEDRDNSGPEIAQIPWAGKTPKETQKEKDEEIVKAEAKQKRLKELERIKLYIEKMQEKAKIQQARKKQKALEEEMKEHYGMSM